MADKDNQNIADQAAISQDDPFAELTRIVGFDPRQPVKSATASVAAANAPSVPETVNASFDEVDFSIDLERELLGDLQLDDAELLESSQPYGNAFAPAGTPSAVAEDFEVAAAQADDLAQVEAIAEDQQPEPEVPAAELEMILAETAPAVENESREPAWDEQPIALARPMFDQPADADGAQAIADALEAELVEAVTLSVDTYASVEDDIEDATDDVAALEAPVQAVAVHGSEAIEEQAEREEPTLSDTIEVAAEADDRSDEPEQFQAYDKDWFQGPELHSYDVAFSEEEQDKVAAAAETARETAVIERAEVYAAIRPEPSRREPEVPQIVADSAQPESALEMSLEAELNALLGNGQAKAAAPAILAATTSKHGDVAPTQVKSMSYGWGLKSPAVARDERPVATPYPATTPSAPVDLAEAAIQNQIGGPTEPAGDSAADADLDGLFDDEDLEAALSSAVSTAFEETSGDAIGSEAEAAQERESESFMPPVGRDPYAAPAPLSPDQRSPQSWSQGASHEPLFDRKTLSPHKVATVARLDVPEIDTVDVPERAVAVADDLDLPEIAFEDEAAKAQHYDDIDAEFSTLLAGMNTGTDHPAPAKHGRFEQNTPIRVEQPREDAYLDERHAAALATAAAGFAASRTDAYPGYDHAYSDGAAAGGGASHANGPDMDLAYDPEFEEEMAGPSYAPIAARSSRRLGMLAAVVVGGVALLGGVAAFALTFGDSPSEAEVALVKADASPVKVKPENPGGTAIPNQDSKVYDSVAGAGAASAPTQEKLLDSAEEPVPMPDDEPVDAADDETAEDMPAAAGDNGGEQDQAAAPKGDDRIEQLIEQEPGVDRSVEVAAVAPRKVRTMIVKSDGSLVAREEPVADQPVDSASEGIVDPAVSTAAPAAEESDAGTAAEASAEQAPPAEQAAPAAAEPPQAAAEQPAKRNAGQTPKTVPVAPVRPSDQPVDIVGEVKAQQVAALDPASAPAPGSWSMQIASQPTEAGAQATYKDLARRYGGVLGGRQAMIVKADIAGKGTFWRVRVPAGSRNEAVKLCESYKSAGGNCFVSK